MKLIDRALSIVSPGWALNRRVAAERLRMIDILSPASYAQRYSTPAYDAASRKRTDNDWPTYLYSADGAILPDSPAMIARTRDAVRNDWCARSVVDAYRRHVVGTGITCRSAARDPVTREELPEFNEKLDRLWDAWANNPKRCDIEGVKTLTEIEAMLCDERITAGEAFLVEVDHPVIGFCVQVFEREQLATQVNVNTPNEVRDGIEIDRYGRAIAYWFYTRHHPLEAQGEQPLRIPADRVHHFYRQERPRQTHGVSRLIPVLRKLRHLRMYEEYQLVRARLEACIGLIVTKPAATTSVGLGLPAESGAETSDSRGSAYFDIEPGMVPVMKDGESVTAFNTQAPGAIYEPFVNHQVKQIGAGAGLDYPTVARDYTNGSFSAQREGHIERDKETDLLQKQMIEQVLRPLRESWTIYQVTRGYVQAPIDFWMDESRPYYLAHDWQPPPKLWIDPSKQQAAAKGAMDSLLSSIQREANTLGIDWRELVRERGEALKFIKRTAASIGMDWKDLAGALFESTEPTAGTVRPDYGTTPPDSATPPRANGAKMNGRRIFEGT